MKKSFSIFRSDEFGAFSGRASFKKFAQDDNVHRSELLSHWNRISFRGRTESMIDAMLLKIVLIALGHHFE